jgi:hypothetical protein
MNRLAPSDTSFDIFVDEEIGRALPSSDTFGELLSLLPGIAPPDAILGLGRISSSDKAATLLKSARAPEPPRLPFKQGAHLPLPHPLDLEWRFTADSAESLLNQLLDVTGEGDRIMLLGVPTVAATAISGSVRREFHVIGEDNVVSSALAHVAEADARFVHRWDAAAPVSAALADPPWYIEPFAEMVGMCSERCMPGATLFLVLPPIGIRPSATVDRECMLEIAKAAGFEPEPSSSEIRYRSPLFELAAFRAAGIGAWLPDWRIGELVRFKKVRAADAAPINVCKRRTFELTLSGVRLRLLLGHEGPDDLQPLVDGEVLPSVSLRFPDRDRASLWTSTNRAFAVDSALALIAMTGIARDRGLVLPNGLAAENSDGRNVGTIDEIRALTHQIERLAEQEYADAAELVGETAWLHMDDARFSPAPSKPFQRPLHGAAA